MANFVLPFLMPMLLGRTIDLRTYTVGGNIYDDADYVETSAKSTNATYHVLQDDVFPYSYFGLPADVVIRIKSNILSSGSGALGLDGLLKDTSWKYNSVIVSVTAMHSTVQRKLKPDAQLLTDWEKKVPSSQTHYASTLFYGGWMVVLFRLQCDIPSDVQAVRKSLTDTIGAVGNLDDTSVGLWEKALKALEENEDIRGNVRPSTHVYSTTSLQEEVTSPESLLKAISDFKEAVGSTGQPLFMDLKPLKDLSDKFDAVEENTEALELLEELDQMYDDIKLTKVSMMRWITETGKDFSDEEEEKINSLLSKINNCLRAFIKVGQEASLFKKMDRSIIEAAHDKYADGLVDGIATYNLAYRRLKEDLDSVCQKSFLHKIKGLLRVYDYEMIKKGQVDGGIEECRKLCIAESRCRSIGYADHLSELDLATGRYFKREKQCWIYFRSTSTAVVNTPSGWSGDMGVYDRNCY
ncbi:uncharacterized protein LOC129221977 [Uloborus diversus]|uniref:uncharacterized protein LOC129221977 n=1 Tax=Uloborus diversus TaxID=327109 RepID=UPI002409EFF6|nr:uncharacterized protein LOC129221977 [Uloborus diversus]XP_054712361.1 uncharacterized protein LOC129221977 [Uloborus diversus]